MTLSSDVVLPLVKLALGSLYKLGLCFWFVWVFATCICPGARGVLYLRTFARTSELVCTSGDGANAMAYI